MACHTTHPSSAGKHHTRHRHEPHRDNRSRTSQASIPMSGAAVLIFYPSFALSYPKDNGGKLVGQCEISHPVARAPSINVLSSDDADLHSPADGIDGVLSPKTNVMFQAHDKAEYQPLGARISSACPNSHKHTRRTVTAWLARQGSTTSTRTAARSTPRRTRTSSRTWRSTTCSCTLVGRSGRGAHLSVHKPPGALTRRTV